MYGLDASPEQQTAVEAFLNCDFPNLAINAVAGSGKTHTLVILNRGLIDSGVEPEDILNLSFAKRDAITFQRRMPQGTNNKTAHALGLAAWSKAREGSRPQVTPLKSWKIADKLKLKVNKDFPDFTRLLALLKATAVVPATIPYNFNPIARTLTSDLVAAIINANSLDTGDRAIERISDIMFDALTLSIELAMGKGPQDLGGNSPYIDFDDMIYMPVIFGGIFPEYNYVICDEIQDFSPLQRELVTCISTESTRIVGVGDPHQAIYGFRGASAAGFDDFIQRFECKTYPLSVSFRSDQLIIRTAQGLVPHIQARPEAELGDVNLHYGEWGANHIKTGDAILCRNNKPLVSIFYSLISQGVPAKILGTDIGKVLISRVKKFPKGLSLAKFILHCDAWGQDQYNKAMKAGYENKAATVLDQAHIFHIIATNLEGDQAIQERVIAQLTSMFSDDIAPVTLSSIHKAKGNEWDRVWLLDPHLIPSKYAIKSGNTEQEYNLLYVAYTRAKHELYAVNSTDNMDLN